MQGGLMMENKQSITEIAKQAITDDEILMAKYATPASVLEFLEDDSNFKQLSDVLCDALIETDNCTEEQDLNELISKLKELAKPQGLEEYKIERWLSGKTKTIQKRNDAIKLCFALKLNREKSNQFLNKCGHYALSFRNAEDVTFIYCILKGKSFPEAESLYSDYLKAKYDNNNYDEEDSSNSHSGDTTHRLIGDFNIESWETDDEFLNSYLIENKAKFINYETTALKTYYIWKNEFYFSVIYTDLIEESGSIVMRDELGKQEAKPVRALSLNSALAKFSDSDSLLFPAYKIMNNNLLNSEAALKKVKQISKQHQDLESQKIISVFCDDIIKSEKILKHVLGSLESKGSPDTPLFRCVLGLGSNNSLENLKVGKLPITESNIDLINQYCKECNSYGFYKDSDGKMKLTKPNSNTIAANMIYTVLYLLDETDLSKSEIASIEYSSLRHGSKGYSIVIKTGNGKKKRYMISEETIKVIKTYLSIDGVGRLKNKSDSSLYDNKSLHGSVLKKFPDGKTLVLPDNNSKQIGKDISLRKAFVLFYLLYYIYSFTLDIQYDDFDSLVTEFGYDEAFDQLNKLLDICNLAKLYPADAFDWLVLRCLKECHKPNSNYEDNDALLFLNRIIRMSYDSEYKTTDD